MPTNRWEVWSRFAYQSRNSVLIADGDEEQWIYKRAAECGYTDQTRIVIEAFTDQVLSWTRDSSDHRRPFISLNAI